MKKISKISCIFACMSLVACGDITSSFNPTNDVTNLLKGIKEPNKITSDPRNSHEFKSFLDKFSNFSLRFNDSYLNNYDDKSSNVAISPLSLFFALAMTSECTSYNSQIELLNALNVTTTELRENLPILYALENTTSYTIDDVKNEKVLMSVKDLNNSIWLSKELNKSQETLENLSEYYYTESYDTDFKKNNSKANKDFKEYVKDKTRGLIDRDFDLDINTLLVLLNTFYLKDIWDKNNSELTLTENTYNFTKRNNSTIKTKLMKGKYHAGRALRKDTYSSFFTKTQNGLNISFLLPNDNYKLEDVFTKENIDYILDYDNYEYSNEKLKKRYYTSVQFPQFEASCDKDLAPLLRSEFNINEIFSNLNANFSNISSDDIYIDQIIHSTKLKVDKKGIEGAAITTAIAPGSAGPSIDEYEDIYEIFTVDKSFGYVITDNYGVILFSGIINSI